MTELIPETAVPPAFPPDTTHTIASVPTPEAEFDAIESLIRLIVGGSLEVPAELVVRLKRWEELAGQQKGTTNPLRAIPTPETSAEQIRYALVGLIFATHDQVRLGTSRLGRFANVTTRTFLRAAHPFTSSRAMQPIQNQYNEWVARGETAVNQWIERGRAEEPRSRTIARGALGHTIDEVIELLADNPEIRDLVQSQGTSIAGEMVDGVRARTVTADYLLERVARGLLRRPPRAQLPAPTTEVMTQAAEFHHTD